MNVDRGRARGALLGLAVGDALGATLEFSRPEPPPFPALAAGPQTEIVGGGPFALAAGQVTDDTQMAACLAASLLERRTYAIDDVSLRYAAWSRVAFDAGAQTRAALAAVEAGTPPGEAGRAVWLAAEGRRPAGNGSLMRTAPIGVWFARDRRARIPAALDDSAVTHFDPRCQLACVALDGAVAAALTQGPGRPAALLDAAGAEVECALPMLEEAAALPGAELRAAADAVREDLALAREEDPRLAEPDVHLLDTQGFVRVALRLAFWELLHAPGFEAALVDAVNRGGDADTNGAITGALLGAFWGEAAIPSRWRQAVLSALEGQEGPFATAYHPRRLLEMVDAL